MDLKNIKTIVNGTEKDSMPIRDKADPRNYFVYDSADRSVYVTNGEWSLLSAFSEAFFFLIKKFLLQERLSKVERAARNNSTTSLRLLLHLVSLLFCGRERKLVQSSKSENQKKGKRVIRLQQSHYKI